MNKKSILFLLFGLLISFASVGCEDDPVDDDVDGKGDGTTVTDTLQGSTGVDKDITVAPASDNTVYLNGYYLIEEGSTLTIPAGTKVIGIPEAENAQNQPAAIIAARGTASMPSGQLIANGTANNPIVFTSKFAAGSRGRSNWGGIILLGLADNNLDSKSGNIEGTGGDYGPGGVGSAKENDNSGTLRYVRIEYGGTKVSPDNEINGLTFGSVGNGTTVEYIQSHMIADDGFEWFGGSVNCKYLISSGNDDDAFDMDVGYHGNLQYLFALQDPDLANRGFEINNDGDGSYNTPYTSAMVSNVTIVGTGKDVANSDDNDGFYLRGNSRLKITNAISTNFRYAMVANGQGTGKAILDDSCWVKQSILHGRTGPYLNKDAPDFSSKTGGWGNFEEDPNLVSITFSNPQPRPQNPNAAGIGNPPSNGFFDTGANYAGAFDPNGTGYWFDGWANWAKN